MLAGMPTWLRSLLSCARRFRNCVVMIAIPIPIHTPDAPDEPVELLTVPVIASEA